jgi:hypothetical protein
MHSKNGILSTSLDDSHPVLTANTSSDTPGLSFLGSINFAPALKASISFFRMAVPLASVSYSTGLSAVVDSVKGISKQRCKSNSFDLVAFGNFKGSIGNYSRNLLNPLMKSLRHGCLDEIPAAYQ